MVEFLERGDSGSDLNNFFNNERSLTMLRTLFFAREKVDLDHSLSHSFQ